MQSTISTANLITSSANSNVHQRRRLTSYSSSDDDDMLPSNGINNPAFNGESGGGCGNGTGTCCSSSSTATSPTTATVVVDIEDLLNKRNSEQNKNKPKETDVTPSSEIEP